jgi:molybdopterin converting factor small subunit
MTAGHNEIQVTVRLYSFFKELAGCDSFSERLPGDSKLGDLVRQVVIRFPRLEPMQKSMLTAVGVEYQNLTYVLNEGEEVSLFPPVQGG